MQALQASVPPQPPRSAGMPLDTILAHPAIFTSIRTPTGEGYRIIAASRSLRPEERQTLTRCSPSHEALCGAEPQASALACYPLPTGRVCVAYTCPAGAEHTGRGGQRVYTYNLVLESADFGRFGFSPFAIVRAAMEQGLTSPQLKPKESLEPVNLPLDNAWCPRDGEHPAAAQGTRWKRCVVHRLLRGAPVVVRVETSATEAAEVLWMSLPGPVRARLSLSAGLRFSSSRPHHLVIVSAPDARLKDLCESRDALLIETPKESEVEACADGAWLAFVEQHWRRNRIGALTSRTSVPYEDVSTEALERIGRLHLVLEEIPSANVPRLLAVLEEHADGATRGCEGALRGEVLATTKTALHAALSRLPLEALPGHWRQLSDLWRKSRSACSNCQPLVALALQRLAARDVLEASELALDVACPVQGAVDEAAHALQLSELVLAALVVRPDEVEGTVARREEIANRWRLRRPDFALPSSACPPNAPPPTGG